MAATPTPPRPGGRRIERSAVWSFVPVIAMLPFSLLALFVIWLPITVVTRIGFIWMILAFGATVPLLFVRPFQIRVLTPILGARQPSNDEQATIRPLWTQIAQANALPPERYVVRILPSDELNAFACGGHLVVVTSFAVDELTEAELQGVLAHELSHHLGMHTVAITLGHWLSAPVVLLARVGFFLQNVATAAADSFGRRSPLIEAVGSAAAMIVRGVSFVFTIGLRAGETLGNIVGHESEFEADRLAVGMGFGRELARALRRVVASNPAQRRGGWRARLGSSHPSARIRVARIEALLRHPAR